MKRLVSALAIVLATAGLSFGAAAVHNDQGQAQIDGFTGVPSVGFASIGGAAGGQYQYGVGLATPGDTAYDVQYNQQTQNDGYAGTDGFSTVQGGAWQTNQQQLGGGVANGGIYAYGQGQAIGGGSGVYSNQNGTSSIAGSASAGIGASGAFAAGGALTGAVQTQEFNGQYFNANVGPNSGIVQAGAQHSETTTGVIAAGPGGAGLAGAAVIQAGGTAAQNNGAGTAMQGEGTAAGEAIAGSISGGSAVAGANAQGSQIHGYTQYNQSPDGTSQQFQFGVVGTDVNATSGP